MKSLLDFILESRENENYRDFPAKQQKPTKPFSLRHKKYAPSDPAYLYQLTKEYNQKKDEYDEYKKNCIQINTDNFEILLDKLLTAMNSRQGQNNFVLSAETCTFTNYYFGENGTHDFFDDVEDAVVKARLALESKDLNMGRFKRTRSGKAMGYYGETTAFSQSVYASMCIIAQAYNVNIPKYQKEFDMLQITSVAWKQQDWEEHTYNKTEKRRETAYNKINKKYAKESEKLIKLREKFKKTSMYKTIIEILDKVENDLQAVEPNFKKWEEQIRTIELEDEAVEKTKDLVADAIEDAFGENPRLATSTLSLHQLTRKAYIETQKLPEIKLLDKRNSGWMAGLYWEATFEVIDSNGKSHGKTTIRDRGIRGDNGEQVPGFGVWD